MPVLNQTKVTLAPHEISVVVPVYKGEATLRDLLLEILPLTAVVKSPGGLNWRIAEVILVFDNGPDGSAETIRSLEREHSVVRSVWLSRNFGQHSATLAGMASSGAEWIATLDEDGQHDPADIAVLLDAALADGAPLVYAKPTNEPPHGFVRNAASRSAKVVVSRLSGNPAMTDYQSFRLVLGEVGRSIAAYSGAQVYLDVALGWVASKYTTAGVELRQDTRRTSGYSLPTLFSHFWRLILSSGTRGLRLVSALGVAFALAGLVLAIVFAIQRLTSGNLPAGWTSQITVILVAAGAILFSLGVIAEYIGVVVNMALGKPPYLIMNDPENGPLGRRIFTL